MRVSGLSIILIFISLTSFAQISDTLKVRLVAGSEVIRGATLIVVDLAPPTGTITDINGNATLIVPRNKDIVEINLMGPYVKLKIERPADSVIFDLNSKKAKFYYQNKRISTKKQIVKDY